MVGNISIFACNSLVKPIPIIVIGDLRAIYRKDKSSKTTLGKIKRGNIRDKRLAPGNQLEETKDPSPTRSVVRNTTRLAHRIRKRLFFTTPWRF